MSRNGPGTANGEPLALVFERWATTRGVENSSVKQYRTMLTRAVEPFFGADGVREITSAQIERWVEWMIHHRGYKPSTLRFRFSILMSVFDWAMERGLTDTIPPGR